MSRCGLFVGGLAWSLAEVGSVRQRVDTSAVTAVEAIGALLQERNMGTEELLQQLSGYASAAVTPGAEGSYVKSLKAVSQDITTQVEKKITDGQAATQTKLDSLFANLGAANTAANDAKTTAAANDKSWFECAAVEKTKRQDAEAAEQSLTSARTSENEACQLQQDNKGFAFDATGKYKLDFACDFMVDGNCSAAIGSWNQGTIQKMSTDARALLSQEQTHYNELKASCEAKTTARQEAESVLGAAESAWSNQRAACKKLAAQRSASMCAFGTKAQAKCTSEAAFKVLVAATKKAQGDADSEVDRETEWIASRTTQCMIAKSMQKGLNAALGEGDLEACSGEVNFNQDVGRLNTHQADFETLSKANICADGPISFFNGKAWRIPAGDKPASKSYTTVDFAPQLDPSTSNNFHFCEAPQ